MNGGVAHRAGLILLRLVVECGSCRRPGVRGKRVALEAQQVYLRALQQARIRGAVRHVARGATLDFHGFMFVNERPGLFRVAGETNQVLRTRGAQLPRLEPAVLIVAVRALHQSFVHAVMEGPVELLFLVEVTGVAKIRLLGLEQELAFFRLVRIVAIRATNAILEVS